VLSRGFVIAIGGAALGTACSLFIDTDDLGGQAAPSSLNDGGQQSTPPDATAGADGGNGIACVADFKNDAKNCGVCGRDCLGGACVEGRCQVAEFAKLSGVPWYMTSDADALYVLTRNTENAPTEGDVLRVEKSTRKVTTLAKGITPAPFDLKVDASYVYWTAAFDSPATTLQRRSKFVDGDPQITTLASLSYGLELVLVPNRIIVSGWNSSKLYAVPINGGAAAEITGGGFFRAEGLAFDGTTVFIASTNSSSMERQQILRMDANGTSAQISHTNAWGRRIAVAGDYILGVAGMNLTVVKKADNSPPRSIALSKDSFPGSVIYDESSKAAYLANSGGDMIFRSPGPDFLTLEPIAVNQSRPIDLAVDAKAIYWTASRTPSVNVLVK